MAQLFTEEEQKQIMSAGQRVWEYVAADYMELSEGKSIRRSEVIEVVCDAGRLEERLPVELRERVRNAPYAELQRILKRQFVHARYE